MLYSTTHNFLYIHVSKTGGSSLEQTLLPFCHHPQLNKFDKLLSKARLHWNHHRHHFKQHDGINVARQVLPHAEFDDLFKFALVRNPWDWLVSLYHFLRRKSCHRHSTRILQMSFADYVEFEIRRNARHQHPFFMDRHGRILVDYLGRFEALEKEFDYICARIGIERPELARCGIHAREPYQHFYTPALKDKVARHWQKDIAILGYEFEGYAGGSITEHHAAPGVGKPVLISAL